MQTQIMGETLEVTEGTTYETLAKKYKNRFQSEIVLAKRGNEYQELSNPVESGQEISFLDLTHIDGMRVYQRGVSFLLAKAVREMLGPEVKIIIENSINKNFYCEFDGGVDVTDALLLQLQKCMEELANQDIPFAKSVWRREEAIELFRKQNMEEKANLFRFKRASYVHLYSLGDYYDCYYGAMVPSTGYLKSFGLKCYQNGFLLQFPAMESPGEIQEFRDLKKVYHVFMEQKNWCDLMQVRTIADLNACIVNGNFGNLIRINEALHEKKIAQIADTIADRLENVKIVLIAGPSSSGKTTFARRLCVQLRVNGIVPHTISLDDYFLDRDKTPLDETGKQNFENINALDLKQFNEDLKKLIGGKTVQLPTFNFLTGKREYKGRFLRLAPDEICVIEGIHGLNDKLTEAISEINKFKIYISALTQLNVDGHNRISTADNRLIRRLVRDYHFRGNDACATIDAWPYVVRGETENIFPFQENADVMFNSATIYELSILKPFAEALLFKIDRSMPEFVSAKRLIKFLDYFLGVGIEDLPNNSIMREFVGGSCFHV